jgi:hypothetical protein
MSHKYKIGETLEFKEEYRDFWYRGSRYFRITEIGLEDITGPMYRGILLDHKKQALSNGELPCCEFRFKSIEKTLDNLEVGDVVENKFIGERTVLVVLPGLYALSGTSSKEEFGAWAAPYNLKKQNYTIKGQAPKPEPKEMTMKELAELMNKIAAEIGYTIEFNKTHITTEGKKVIISGE